MDNTPYSNEQMTLKRVTTVTVSARSGLIEDKTGILFFFSVKAFICFAKA